MKMVFCDLCMTQIAEKEPIFKLTIFTEMTRLLSECHDTASPGAWSTSCSEISYYRLWTPIYDPSVSLTLEVCKDCRDKIKPFLDGLKEALQKLVRE